MRFKPLSFLILSLFFSVLAAPAQSPAPVQVKERVVATRQGMLVVFEPENKGTHPNEYKKPTE